MDTVAGEGPVRHQIGEIIGGVHGTPAKIAAYRLETIIRYAEGRAKGMHMVDPRKARSVQLKNLRVEFGIAARRWEQAAAELRGILEEWRERGVPEDRLIKS